MILRFKLHCFLLIFGAIFLTSCVSAISPIQEKIKGVSEASVASYAKDGNSKGLVLLDVNWGRAEQCSSYDFAQIVSFSFDTMPLNNRTDKAKADLLIQTQDLVNVSPNFISYAILVEPGEYALSESVVKVKKNTLENYWVVSRKHLFTGAKPAGDGGSFKVKAGETVYIGSFGLACYETPMLWRYYVEAAHFKNYLEDFANKYPFINPKNVKYRLFDTTNYGLPYKNK